MPQQFIIGDDEAELDLPVGSRSFLDRLNDQVRKDKNDLRWMLQKTTKTFCDMENVHVCNIGISIIHGKELITQTISVPSRTQKISQWNKCSTFLQNWCPNKMRSLDWKKIGWENHSWKYFVFDRWWTSHQSSAYKGLRLFRFCIVSW